MPASLNIETPYKNGGWLILPLHLLQSEYRSFPENTYCIFLAVLATNASQN